MFESMLLLLKKNLLFIFVIPFWFLQGRPHLKLQLAKRVQIPVEQLPLNSEFYSFLEEEKAHGRKLFLISASNEQAVASVNSHFDFFSEAIGSDESTNLKSLNKLNFIKQHNAGANFAYAGNSSADLPIWKEASEAMLVNCSDRLGDSLNAEKIAHFDSPPSLVGNLWQAIRPHQWLKNLLIFVPLVLSHQLDQLELLFLAGIAFISFCLCASSVYILNDLLDLKADRNHHSKSKRAFASGDLPIAIGFIAGPLLFLSGFIIALSLPASFQSVLLLYWLLTSLYSFYLKRVFIIDVLTLAVLYSIRIIAGAAAITVESTVWLLAFSFFLFLGLALVKRVTELLNVVADGNDEIEGRAYRAQHLTLLSRIGTVSSAAAILVFILYITAPETTVLYSQPLVLWLICPLLMYLLYRIWSFAHRRQLEEDPVLFALTDRVGQIIALACGVLVWLAA